MTPRAHRGELELAARIAARAGVLVWQAEVRRRHGRLIWKYQVPEIPSVRRLLPLVSSPDRGDAWDPVCAPDHARMVACSTRAIERGDPAYHQEFRLLVDGATLWVEEDVTIERVGEDAWHLIGTLTDVTARRAAQTTQQRAEAQVRQLLEQVECMLWIAHATVNGEQVEWRFDVPASRLRHRLWGPDAPKHDVFGICGRGIYGRAEIPERVTIEQRAFEAVRRDAPGYEHEFRVFTPQGPLWLHESVSLTRLAVDRWQLVGVTTDVTARREADSARRATELRLQQLLAHADCMIWEARVCQEADGGMAWTFYTPVSRLYRQLFGRDPDPDQPLLWSHVDVPEIQEMHARSAGAMLSGASGYAQEFRVIGQDQTHWLNEQVSITPLGPREWKLVGVVTDITARRTAESALGAEKERLAVTFRAMSEGVVTTDTRGRVQFLNRAAETLVGETATYAVGQTLERLCRFRHARSGDDYRLPLDDVLAHGTTIDLPAPLALNPAEGHTLLVAGRCAPVRDAAGEIIGAVLVFDDVTERQRLDEHLQRASKLESIGILAGGIAHDFNNILTTIMGNISLALLDATPGTPMHQSLEDAHNATGRARDLTQQLLTFAKGGDPVRAAVHLPELITEVARFALHGAAVKCEFQLANDLWWADADKGQFAQIIQNLVLNAVQAMGPGGCLCISASNTTVAPGDRLPLRPGDYVRIAVKDTGPGINPEHRARIFDPYFTTKQHGHGLGLPTVYSIVRRHGGHIEVDSQPGRGTTFRFWLPALRHAPRSARPPSGEPGALQGRVLFMDDEPAIRKLGAGLLRRLGLEVTLAVDGAEAVRLFEEARSRNQPYDVVVMDLTVPGGMGGREALDRLRQIDPHVRAVVSSGYSSDPVLANHRAYGFCGMIAKPYQLDVFEQVLREAFGAGPANAGAPRA